MLPPGEWDKKTLLGIDEMQRKQLQKQEERKKKRKRHPTKEKEGIYYLKVEFALCLISPFFLNRF